MNLRQIILLPLFLVFIGCDSNGGSGTANTTPPPEVVGTWVGKQSIESLATFTQSDGTCGEILVGDASELGTYYLDAFEIKANGALLQLSTIDINSSSTGDFIHKGQVNSDGKVIVNANVLSELAAEGAVLKAYDHKISAVENILTYTIVHQEVLHQGETYIMDNSSDEYFRATKSELSKYIEQSKNCTKNQKLSSP